MAARSSSRALRSAMLRCRVPCPAGAPGHSASLMASPVAPSGVDGQEGEQFAGLAQPGADLAAGGGDLQGAEHADLDRRARGSGAGALPGCACRRRWLLPGFGGRCCAEEVRLPCFRRAGCGRAAVAGGLAGLVQLRDDRGEVLSFEVVGLGPGKGRLRRRDAADQAVGGDVAGDAVRPSAQQDDGDAEIAAGFGDAGQPLRGGGSGGGGQHHRDGLRAVCGVCGVCGAGVSDDHGFGLIERRVQCERHHDAADGRVSPLPWRAGEEPGGVGGGDDDLGWRAVGAARRPGQQAGQDGPGGRWCPRSGQAKAAEGGGVGGDLLAAADADGYRAGRGRDGALLAWLLRGREACRGGSGGGGLGFAGAGEGLLVWLVQVQVQVGVVRAGAGRAGAVCRGRPGGGGAGRAVQGGDDRGRRPGGFEAGGEHRAGPVAAPAVDAGQGDGGADHDGGSQSDQRPGRQPYPGRGDVLACSRPPGGRGAARRARAAGRTG